MIQPTNAQQLYPQQGGANAVSINIYNPQAYGSTPNAAAQTCAPYQYTNSLYQMPQASTYAPVAQQPVQPEAYQQFLFKKQLSKLQLKKQFQNNQLQSNKQ